LISRNSVGGKYPVVTLGTVVDFLDSKRRPVTESERKAGPYPYYGANGLQGTIDGYIFDEPLVLLAEDGGHFGAPERGIAYRVSGKTWVNNHAHVIRPKAGLDLAYLCRVLENYDVSPFVTGTTRGKLTKAGAADIPIPVAPLPEQRRIAAILDQADALRAKRREALAQLDSLTQSIFVGMFGDPATNSKNWKTRPLLEGCDEINDCPHSTPAWTDAGLVCLRTSNLTEGGWNWSDTRYVSETTFHERSKRGYVAAGDIVLSREGTVGIAAVVTSDMKVCMGQRLVQVRPSPSFLTSEFLLRHLLFVLSPKRIGQLMVGSTSQHLNVKELKALLIPLPPVALQLEFSRISATLERLKETTKNSLSELDSLFASLQHRAFQGEL
jgi:type I restriction enzyme S subunit